MSGAEEGAKPEIVPLAAVSGQAWIERAPSSHHPAPAWIFGLKGEFFQINAFWCGDWRRKSWQLRQRRVCALFGEIMVQTGCSR